MALSVERQVQYWGLGFVFLLLIFYFLGSALTPFLVGATLAYCLDPVADRLEEMGLGRVTASVLIMLFALFVFLGIVMFLLPMLAEQVRQLVQRVPEMVESLRAYLSTKFPLAFEEGGPLRDAMETVQSRIAESGGILLNSILASTLAVFDFLLLLVVAPVVAFYLLMDWDRMVARVDDLLPRDHQETIRGLARQIDDVLAAFLRGQLTVMAFLATFYSFGLLIVGLDFAVIVGLIAGLISFIPYVGTIVGGAIALGLAFFQFWGDWGWIAAVLAVFGAGQFIEGNILTPKLLGSSVGLHPVWLMFALSAFGVLFGFSGLLIAVPVAACLGVLMRFGLEQYMTGRLYTGQKGQIDPDA